MKKIQALWLSILMLLLVSVPVFADVSSGEPVPAYATSYYVMIEDAPNGGIDMYASPNTSKEKLNDSLIPNGSVLHVDGEKTDDNGTLYGYVDYHGMRGYIPLEYSRIIRESEALQLQSNTSSSQNVDYDAEAYGRAGSVAMYHGPSEQFDVIDGSTAIPNGETLHITEEVENPDGESWVQATHDGVTGYVPEEQILTAERKAILSATPTPVPTSIPTPTPTPKPTTTSTPTPKPTATSTPTPKPTATSTPTPKPTVTNTPTPKPTVTNTPTPEETNTNTPTPEPTSTNTPAPPESGNVTDHPSETPTEAPDLSGEDFQPEGSETENTASSETRTAVSPVLIGIGGALVAILILLLVALKRKNDKK